MGDLRKAFSTDKDLMKTGVWFDYDGMRFRCAHAGALNPNWLKQLDIVQKPHRRAIELKLLPEEKAEELNLDLFIRATLLDWENVELDGQPVKFSQENARKLLTEFPLLWQLLRGDAGDATNFRAGNAEDDAKN